MTPSEKLHSILDGETAGIDTSEVFYELSNNPELQQEFLDLMKMKQLMSGAQEAPPEHLRRGILAGVGLGGSGLWYYLQNSSMVAASTAFLSSKVGAAIVAGMVGVLATFMIMDDESTPSTQSAQTATSQQIENLTSATPILIEIPVVSSTNASSNSNSTSSSSTTIASTNTGNNNIVAKNENSNFVATTNDNEPESNNTSVQVSDSPYLLASRSDEVYDQSATETINYNKEFLPVSQSNQPSGFIINPSNRISNYDSEQQMLFSLQGKGITNNSLITPDMSTTEAPSINNIGIALMYSVSDEFAVGLEFGQEFFVRRVKTNSFNTEESMLDNQLTFWGGLKASYTFNDLQIISNLRPTTTLLIGGTNTGWVTKASAGFIYDISNKLAMFGGPEWTTGIYQFDSQFLSTHKWGFQYGLALKF